jgi:hypothetical protein
MNRAPEGAEEKAVVKTSEAYYNRLLPHFLPHVFSPYIEKAF